MSGIAITFPSSPSEGQSYLADNGFTYIYDSQKNRWKRGGEFVRSPKVLTIAGTAVTTTGSGIATGPTGALIYEVPGTVNPSGEVGVDSYKAYRAANSYPNYTEIQVSISSAFSSVAYAATFTGTTHNIPSSSLSGDTTYYLRARQFVGSDASAAGVGAISGYSANPVKFTTSSVYIDTPTIVSIAGTTQFPVYQIGYASTTLPATVTYSGGGISNLDKVEWRVTGSRIPTSTGDTALAEIGIGTHSSATLANALVLALPFSGATGVGITDDVNNAIRTASGASAGTTKTVTANGSVSIGTVGIASTTSHFYNGAAKFNGSGDYISIADNSDFTLDGDFTVECWWYANSLGAFTRIWSWGTYNGVGSFGLEVNSNDAGSYRRIVTWFDETQYNGTNYSVGAKKWYHHAVVRKNGVVSVYQDGYHLYSFADTATINRSEPFYLGGLYAYENNSDAALNGYIQDFKIYKGLAKYTENFTPPLPTYGTISYTTGVPNVGIATTAFYQSTGDVGIAETSSTAADALVLAMPMNRTFGFQDINVAIRGLTSGASAGTAKTVGLGTTSTANAPTHPRISSTESKWYDGAAYFDGQSGPNYAFVNSPLTDFSFGTGDFTIELWVYLLSWQTTYNARTILEFRPQATNGDYLALSADRNGDLYCNLDTTNNLPGAYSSGENILNRWVHIAACRKSGSLTMFLNGRSLGSKSATTNSSAGQVAIGRNAFDSTLGMHGHLQDLKIYKGFAKYSTDFTPPQPICGFSTDISTQTGFTTTTASGALLSSVVGLGSTSTLSFGAGTHYSGISSITSSSGITTLTDPYAQNLVLALPLADITGVGNSFTNDRNTQIRSVSLVGGGSTKTVTNTGVTTTTSVDQYYSNVANFDGSTTYATITGSSDTAVGAGDFTIEAWVRPEGTGTNQYIIQQIDSGGAGTGNWLFYKNTATQFQLYMTSSPGTWNLVSSGDWGVVTQNKWTHLALTRENGIIKTWNDGKFIASFNVSTNLSETGNIRFGANGGASGQFFDGQIQDFRMYKGVAKYTTNFTPPPPMFGDYVRNTPNKVVFTPGSDYSLEAKNTSGITTSSYSGTRQWGTKSKGGIYDPYASNLVLAITGNNTTTQYDVSGQIRLETPTSSYSSGQTVTSPSGSTYTNKSVTNPGSSAVTFITDQSKYYGYSMYFVGTGNLSSYLSIADSSDFDFQNDWTIECWFYMTRAIGTQEALCASASDYKRPSMFRLTNGKMGYFVSSDGANWDILIGDGSATGQGTITVPSGQWNHVAFQRRGTTYTGYINGVIDLNKTVAGTPYNAAEAYTIGRWGQAYGYQGYIQDFRIYTAAKYNGNFTPPNQIYFA